MTELSGVAPAELTEKNSGRLVLLGTPIGNLSDLSFRAVETLRIADLIVAEDSRQSRKLLTHLGIRNKKMASLFGKGRVDVDTVVELIGTGQVVVLVSDAGMPGVSDPGADFVGAVRAAGLSLEVVPGPSALTSVIALADFDVTEFHFAGFLHAQREARISYLERAKLMGFPVVAFEAPHRIIESLGDISSVYGPGHRVLVAKELTKIHESSVSAEVSSILGSKIVNPPKGEYVMVISATTRIVSSHIEQQRIATVLLKSGIKVKEASVVLSELTGVPRRDAYELLLALRGEGILNDHQSE